MDMDSNILRYESIEEALTLTIRLANKQLKEVAVSLWPTLKVERAHQRLIECLSSSKNMKLSIDEIIHISHFCGRFDALNYMADECNHTRPQPKTAEQENREIKDMLNNMQEILIKSYKLFERITDNKEKVDKIKESKIHYMMQHDKFTASK